MAVVSQGAEHRYREAPDEQPKSGAIREPEPGLVDREPTLGALVSLAGKYRRTIGMSLLAVTGIYVVVASALYLALPARRSTELDFRLEFRGAERGEYPNGTRFSSTEILTPPVLSEAFRSSQLENYLSPDALKSSLVVVQSNEALEALMRSYRGKLADPRLGAIDRERLEQQFLERRESLSQAYYTLSLTTTDGITSIPDSLRVKVLADVLEAWARLTIADKGVALLDIGVLSREVFSHRGATPYEPLAAAETLRAKVESIKANVDQLLALPGAKVVRSGAGGRSLAELREVLSELLDYRIRPLAGRIVAEGLTRSPGGAQHFLLTRLTSLELETREAEERSESIRRALQAYVDVRDEQGARGAAVDGNGGGATTLIPQIDASFLDRIVALGRQPADIEYRQGLVDEYRDAALRIAPLQRESRYFRALLEASPGRSRTATAEDERRVTAELAVIEAEAAAITDDVNGIYSALSRDLNPSTLLYSLGAPPRHSLERPVGLGTLAVLSVLVLFLALPAIVFAVFLVDRARLARARVSN